jgi:CBS domain-containing protein
MKVAEILKAKGSDVVTVEPGVRVMDAVNTMRDKNIGALVVVDANDHLVGVLSEREIVRGLAGNGYRFLELRVGQVMNPTVVTCTPDETVEPIMAHMTRTRTRHVPVLEHGRLAGIVSIGDVVKSRLDHAELENRVLRDIYLSSH